MQEAVEYATAKCGIRCDCKPTDRLNVMGSQLDVAHVICLPIFIVGEESVGPGKWQKQISSHLETKWKEKESTYTQILFEKSPLSVRTTSFSLVKDRRSSLQY